MAQDEKTQQRGEKTRQAILDAAFRLFLQNGYNGTSMRQIARAARVALGGIYNHFEGKGDIFRALLTERMPYPELAATLEEIEDASGPAMLSEAFNRMQLVASQHLDYFALMLTDMREFEGQTIRLLASGLVPQIMHFVERVQKAGGLRSDISGLIVARYFVSLMLGYMVTDLIAYAGEEPLLPGLPGGQQVRSGILELMIDGIAGQDGRPI